MILPEGWEELTLDGLADELVRSGGYDNREDAEAVASIALGVPDGDEVVAPVD